MPSQSNAFSLNGPGLSKPTCRSNGTRPTSAFAPQASLQRNRWYATHSSCKGVPASRSQKVKTQFAVRTRFVLHSMAAEWKSNRNQAALITTWRKMTQYIPALHLRAAAQQHVSLNGPGLSLLTPDLHHFKISLVLRRAHVQRRRSLSRRAYNVIGGIESPRPAVWQHLIQ